MANEIMNVNADHYEIIQDEEGKFSRKAKYEAYCSLPNETKEQKIALLNLLDGSEDVNGLKEHVGKRIEVANVIFNPYDKINEDTGKTEFGVVTYLLTPDGIPYVTSSKSVYFSMKRIFDIFGSPDEEGWENITVQVLKKKGQAHEFIDVKMIG